MGVIGFIGLGHMGAPMSANLVKAGRHVIGFDLAAENAEAAGRHGLAIAASAEDAARQADIVITMLPAGPQMLSVWSQTLAAARPGTLFIDCSTIDGNSARQAHRLAAEAGMASLDAPVSGGVAGAGAATLTFMCGGDKEAFARAEPILALMGRKSVHCGAAGAGQAAKICNNMLLGIAMIGTCEAFLLAEKLGLSHQALFDVASTSSGQCWALTSYCPVPGPVPASPANSGYAPGFSAALMLKDLKLSQEAADGAGALTPLGARAAALYESFVAAGYGGTDFSGIINDLRSRRG